MKKMDKIILSGWACLLMAASSSYGNTNTYSFSYICADNGSGGSGETVTGSFDGTPETNNIIDNITNVTMSFDGIPVTAPILQSGVFSPNVVSINVAQNSISFYNNDGYSFYMGTSEAVAGGNFVAIETANGAVVGFDVPPIQANWLLVPGIAITNQPQSQVGYWGQSVSFSVGVTGGLPPVSYQWLIGSALIINATNAALVLTNLQFTNAGNYSVVVSDSGGNSVTSAPAVLTVNTAGVSLDFRPSLTIQGTVGYTYIIQSSPNLTNTNGWITLTNLTLTQPIQIWVDTSVNASSPFNTMYFYRVLPDN
jgi:hypothetical protein